jgi:hypothetical protein
MAGTMRKTIPQVSKETLLLQTYLERHKPGDEISFTSIEANTGVEMNYKGRGYLRTAIKRAKLEYSAIRGYGIKLADPGTTMPIMINKLDKIDRAVKRADKSHKNLQVQFFEKLSKEEQKQLLFIGAAFGAIRVAAENGKLLYQSKKSVSNAETLKIPVPEY